MELENPSNQMRSVLVAATLIWPEEHDWRLPADFLCLSNELGSPKILVCASDRFRQAAPNWASFSTNNCSYEVVESGLRKNDTNRIFMRCRIHALSVTPAIGCWRLLAHCSNPIAYGDMVQQSD
jgi:hypothetical protein